MLKQGTSQDRRGGEAGLGSQTGGAKGAGPEERSVKRRCAGRCFSFVLFLGSRTNIRRDLLLNFTV